MTYQLTETAYAELEAILVYIAERDGLERALHVNRQFHEAFGKLARMPGMGSTRSQLTGEHARWWPVFNFLVVYEPDDPGVIILRLVHGSRDLDQLFDEE